MKMKYAFSTHRKVLTNKDFIGNTLLLSKSRRLSDSVAEIRSRVKIVEDQNECLKITKHLIDLGQPIGVDLEGNQQSPGLIQVRSNLFVGGKNIYLFRTGIRPALLYDGGIAKLLEHPKVLKIFCGADQDIGSLANANITLNSVFDISVAQKIIEYQNHGTLLYSMKSIRDEESKMLTTSFLGYLKSLRQICSDYGLKENDFASCFGGGRTNYYFTAPNLPNELIAYSAADVDQLIELYQMIRPKIATDFKPIFSDISEAQTFRYIDENLAKQRLLKLRNMSFRSVFFSNLRSDIGKTEFFRNLKSFKGDKKILLANTTQPVAHVIMDSFEITLEVFKKFSRKTKKFSSDFGDEFKIELLLTKANQETEVSQRRKRGRKKKDPNDESKLTTSPLPDSEWAVIFNENYADKEQKSSDVPSKQSEALLITNVSQAHLITQKIIEMECPILLTFFQDGAKHSELNIGITEIAGITGMVELYLGQSISLIFSIGNQEILTSLAPIFESNQVVKIIFGATNQHRKFFHQTLNSQGIKMNKLFVLQGAMNVFDYYKNGCRMNLENMMNSKSLKSFMTRFGLESNKPEIKDSQIIAYHYLNNQIPTELFPMMKNMFDLNCHLSLGNKSSSEDQIKYLNEVYQTNAMFLRKNVNVVREILKKMEIDFNIIYGNEKNSIVNFGGLSESCYTDEEKSIFIEAVTEHLNGTLIETKEMPEEPKSFEHSEIQKFVDLHEEKVTKLKNLGLFDKLFQNRPLKTEKEGKSSDKDSSKTKSQFVTKAPVW